MTVQTRVQSVLVIAFSFLGIGNNTAFTAETAKQESGRLPAVTLPGPSEIQSLAVHPKEITLKGADDTRQIIVTGTLADGRLQDLSGDVDYISKENTIARVTSSGRVIPLGNGSTEITARFGDHHIAVPVHCESMGENLPINFANRIVPIFTKLGCNSGGCHGKASGQNGFKLSLLGFEPEVDYTALVRESRGRRIFLAAPSSSLLLLKPTGAIAHGGGRRLEIGSDEYKLIHRWIAANTPYGKPDDPVVTRITVYPDHRVMTRQNKQQFAVHAHYSDGSVEDITRRAQYESNDPEIAVVEATGLVRTLNLSGEAAIMARYQGQVATFRATVPLGVRIPEYRFEAKSFVDRNIQKKWQLLGIVPSEACTNEDFVRRVYLDITGSLPTLTQVETFLADKDPNKRDKLIDALVETPEYSYYFAGKWADILRVKRGNQLNRAYGTFAFYDWIRSALADDKGYDKMVRDIIGAVGDEIKYPPSVWYKDLQTPDQIVDNAAQVFLGVRIACAQCHHHPYEKWSQDDYWNLAAYFSRLGRKSVQVPGQPAQRQQQQQVLFTRASGNVINKRTGRSASPRPLDADPIPGEGVEDIRQLLVDWMVQPKNPYFAKSVVNRYWAHFFGRGIVDPLDDMRVTNPPSNPELLDALAADFIEHKFSLKHLVKTICKSRTYQLSSLPNEFNKHDKQNYSRYYPKRMSAEVLFDAVCQVTKSPSAFAGLPDDTFGPRRAIMLPDESFTSYFLDVFGRPQRISACECERVSEANLAQALHLLNSEEIQRKLSQPGGRAEMLARDPRPEAAKVDKLFVWAFARKPTAEQAKVVVEHLAAHPKDRQVAYENVLWALINTKEFIFNR